METKIIIGVPGFWESRKDIVISIAKSSGGLLFAGMVLMDTTTKQACELDVYGHDPKLQEAFRIAGGGTIPDAELAAIGRHKHTLYCIASELSADCARNLLRIGS